jgi:hypothetical protein
MSELRMMVEDFIHVRIVWRIVHSTSVVLCRSVSDLCSRTIADVAIRLELYEFLWEDQL